MNKRSPMGLEKEIKLQLPFFWPKIIDFYRPNLDKLRSGAKGS